MFIILQHKGTTKVVNLVKLQTKYLACLTKFTCLKSLIQQASIVNQAAPTKSEQDPYSSKIEEGLPKCRTKKNCLVDQSLSNCFIWKLLLVCGQLFLFFLYMWIETGFSFALKVALKWPLSIIVYCYRCGESRKYLTESFLPSLRTIR